MISSLTKLMTRIQDRMSGAMQLPSLADLITERAQALNLGASFAPAP